MIMSPGCQPARRGRPRPARSARRPAPSPRRRAAARAAATSSASDVAPSAALVRDRAGPPRDPVDRRRTRGPPRIEPAHHVAAHAAEADHADLHVPPRCLATRPAVDVRRDAFRQPTACSTARLSVRSPAGDVRAEVDAQRAPARARRAPRGRRAPAPPSPRRRCSAGPARAGRAASSHVICRNTPVFGPPL